MLLMGLDKQAAEAQQDIDKHLSFDQDIYVKNFEITIRCLGGLLSEYEATNDPQLLKLATDLGRRLLPAFHSPTGMPYEFVNLRTGKVRGAVTNPAEVALLPEFGTLSKLTGEPVYYDAAKRAMTELWKRRSSIGPRRPRHQRRNRQLDRLHRHHQRRHRLLRRIPAQELAALRRPRLPGDVAEERRRHQ